MIPLKFVPAALGFFMGWGLGSPGRIALATTETSGVRPVPHSLKHQGKTRKWLEVLPADCARGGCPLLLLFHGGMGTGERILEQTDMAAKAVRESFVLVAPDADGTQWNDGREIRRSDADDVGFVRKLLADVQSRAKTDPSRTYAAGVSNGGMFTLRLACELSDRFVAVASVIGNQVERLTSSCKPSKPLSVFLIHSTEDPLMPYGGGQVTGPFGHHKLGAVLSSDATLELWKKLEDCTGKGTALELDQDPADGTSVRINVWRPCRDGVEVRRWAVVGGGHTWPGAKLPSRLPTGRMSKEFDATAEVWKFLAAHRR